MRRPHVLPHQWQQLGVLSCVPPRHSSWELAAAQHELKPQKAKCRMRHCLQNFGGIVILCVGSGSNHTVASTKEILANQGTNRICQEAGSRLIASPSIRPPKDGSTSARAETTPRRASTRSNLLKLLSCFLCPFLFFQSDTIPAMAAVFGGLYKGPLTRARTMSRASFRSRHEEMRNWRR